MTRRRQLLLLLSAIALLVTSFALVPLVARAEPGDYRVDTTLDNLVFDPATPAGTYCQLGVANDCSLRRAIGEANRDGIASEISFGVTGTLTLDTLKGRLRITEQNLTIDATPVFPETGIKVRLDGGGATFPGLTLESSGVTIKGLSITGFTGLLEPQGAGILISGPTATGNTISGNFIGVLPDGATLAGNLYGVRITNGASGNAISGNNIIGASLVAGVQIENSSTNTVASSSIGIGVGDVALRNGEAGIVISSSGAGTSTGNTIGGTSSSLANTISGNGPANLIDRAGILLTGAGTTGNFIRANRIGLNATGLTAVPNSGDGIRIESGANGNTIVGSLAAPVIVSGNRAYGIRITGAGTISNTVGVGVYVGLNGDRAAAVGNESGGIAIQDSAAANTVNGSTVAGNTGGPGVFVTSGSAAGNVITNSFIGRLTNPNTSALLTLPNAVGIQILNAGATSVQSSTIGNNSQAGIQIQGTNPVTVTGSTIVDNTQAGVLLDGASGAVLSTNTVSGNLQTGVLLRGATGTSVLNNTITGNAIGGVLLETGGVTTTNTTLTDNTISGNGQYGLRLSGALTTTLRRTYVGLNPARNDRLPNAGNGIEIFDARNTFATETYVAGNAAAGIVVSGTNTLSTTIDNTVAGLSEPTPGAGFIASEANAGPAVRITGGARQTSVTRGTLAGDATAAAGPAGVLIEGSNILTVTVSNLRIGWVPTTSSPSSSPIAHPFGVGVSVTGPVSNVQILTNTLRYNKGAAIAVSGDANRVSILGNGLSRNGEAIRLLGTSLLTARPPAADPGSQSNPNHDIDPPPVDVATFSDPLRVHVNDQGVIDGFVITSTNRTELGLDPVSACVTCTIQIFRPGPDPEATPGQGWEVVGTRAIGGALTATSFAADPATGRFERQIVGGAGASGTQLLLVATDGFGNSSEYSVFPVSSGLSLLPAVSQRSAAPGETVTYTLQLSNSGSLDLTNLRLTTTNPLARWLLKTDPLTTTTFTLPAGAQKTLTVTLTLPQGADPSVRVPITDVTTVTITRAGTTPLTATARLETAVLPRPIVEVSPTTSLGSGRPGDTVSHVHVLRNTGNITATATLTWLTVDAAGASGIWTTVPNAQSFQMPPGQESRVSIAVTVPPGAQVTNPDGSPVQATTVVSATVPGDAAAGYPARTITFTDTTRVDLSPNAEITDGDQEQEATAGGQVSFFHTVRNLSNDPASFCLEWATNKGSTVSFVSATTGFNIDAKGCFSLDTATNEAQGRFREAQFRVVVQVGARLLPGEIETLNISLREVSTSEIIGAASVVDRVVITGGQVLPRIWLPLLKK